MTPGSQNTTISYNNNATSGGIHPDARPLDMNLITGVEQMREIIDQLPITRDQVRVIPGKQCVWCLRDFGAVALHNIYYSESFGGWMVRTDHGGASLPVSCCYSSKELALRRVS